MPGALFFMVYDNRNGESVTFSPRLAYGHYEPRYFPELEYEELNGTGIFDKHMVFQGRCTKHCRRWPKHDTEGGSIDINSTSEQAVWALGMREGFASDDPAEGIKYHEQFGSFSIDMLRTHGATEPPFLGADTPSEGTTLLTEYGSLADIQSTLHAVFMILAIVGLMPLGVVILRLGGAARWHGLNQTAAMVFVLAGFGLGIVTSFRYQRSRHFDSYHQILGMMLTAFFLVQFAVGFLNHRQYRKTQVPSKYNVYHVWFGRLLILLAIMNGFFGFTFALNRRYGMVLAGLIIAVCVASLFVIIGRQWLNKRRGVDSYPFGAPCSPYNDSPPFPSHGTRPWRGSVPASGTHGFPTEPPPRYESTLEDVASAENHRSIGLVPVPGHHRRPEPKNSVDSQARDLGSPQTPRELL